MFKTKNCHLDWCGNPNFYFRLQLLNGSAQSKSLFFPNCVTACVFHKLLQLYKDYKQSEWKLSSFVEHKNLQIFDKRPKEKKDIVIQTSKKYSAFFVINGRSFKAEGVIENQLMRNEIEKIPNVIYIYQAKVIIRKTIFLECDIKLHFQYVWSADNCSGLSDKIYTQSPSYEIFFERSSSFSYSLDDIYQEFLYALQMSLSLPHSSKYSIASNMLFFKTFSQDNILPDSLKV